MAWFAVTSLMRTLELEFLQPYPRLVLDNTQAVEELHRRLGQLLAFLEECESQFGDDDETMTDRKARIKDVAVRIEDEIESQIIDICGREHTRGSLTGRYLKYLKHKRFQNTLQSAIKCTGEFMELVKNKQPVKDLYVKDDDDIPSSSKRVEQKGAAASSNLQITMVGRHQELTMIKEMLLQDSHKQRRVVPIVGMGGIGKTTFAKRLYEDPMVASHFDVVAWTTVSGGCDIRRTLLQLLSTMQITEEEIINKTNEQLADLLRKCLIGRRYLIIVDNIWSTDFWDEIQMCFPDNSNGSRILLTTRLQEVGRYTSSQNYLLNMGFLNSDESWQLFYVRILNSGVLPMKLGGIWRHIVDYCKGLPLAIVIVAGLLQATNESLWESEQIEKILYASVTTSLSESISEILRLSYNHLPNSLRICFLYLGVFVEDSVIPAKKVIRLWIAEGLVKAEGDQRSLEEVAEDCLKDLVCRSLVLIDTLGLNGKIKSCKVHGMVHEFCRNEAMKEGLLHVASTHSPSICSHRWLSFETMYPKCDEHNAFNKCGSLLCFYDDGHMTRVYQLPANHFERLRVLDLSCLYFVNGLPSFVADLILLRYLALRPSKDFHSLPVSKDWNLQTLVLLENRPNVLGVEANLLVPKIWELPKLRHLQVCTTFVLDTPSIVKEHLQTLYWLRPSQCTAEAFLRIPNVKVMGIFMEDSVKFGEPNCLDNLKYLRQLEKLKIKSRHNPVLLPVADAFPVQLKKLELKGTLLPWDAMSTVLGTLPNLEVLKLKDGAFQGQYWEVTQGGFSRLKSLLIDGSNLEHWEATIDVFPVLERLFLKVCYDLEAIPSSFGDIATLQLIELSHCYPVLVNSAKQIQEEQRDYGNDVLVVHSNNIWIIPEDRYGEEELLLEGR